MARTPSIRNGSGSSTRATSLYDKLRTDLISGELLPGSRLAIEALAARYSASATPLREALNRLVSEGLVERRELRGFAVARISEQDLAEITKTRCWLEELALRESIANHTTEWEEAVVLAHHRLNRTPRSLTDNRFEDNPEWEPLHRAFHTALISGCDSRWLIGFCEQLADQHNRYRTLSAPRAFHNKRDVNSEHQLIMEAAIAGDADEAARLLRSHIERTAEIVKSNPLLFEHREE
ncbi:GntR family transcriptional regulator [Marinobacterium sp. D7]|uniref:GntR family transcriptional regulator n=1 Tax=Marinobacterium ramblicola TaxID=2849041 RepID=UPI001C2D8A31|nr:GntR family transcriptional regulator [Marinobacterium ramblicola]MBV1788699.1 GntR family transcriptional regulator [Marinobacterium ramblicola]